MASNTEDLTKALEAVAEETEEKVASENISASDEDEASAEAPKKGKSTAVPYSRFKEVNDKLGESAKAIEELNNKLTQRDEELSKMVHLLGERDQAQRTIDKINELYTTRNDLRELIDRLDNAVKGNEEALEKTEEKKADAEAKGDTKAVRELEKVSKQLEATKSELEHSLAETQADLILDKADRILESYFDNLPEAYGDDDKRVLSDRLVDKIDWDEIEQDPSKLTSVLARDFKSTVEWYGSPRGAVKADTEETSTKETREPSVDDLKKADWGKLKVAGKDAKGREVFKPAVSDDDFTKALAAAIRKDNRR